MDTLRGNSFEALRACASEAIEGHVSKAAFQSGWASCSDNFARMIAQTRIPVEQSTQNDTFVDPAQRKSVVIAQKKKVAKYE